MKKSSLKIGSKADMDFIESLFKHRVTPTVKPEDLKPENYNPPLILGAYSYAADKPIGK